MRFFQLAATAAMLLHMGNFVHANPMFTDHTNAALDSSAECNGFRVTFPVGSDISFEENTKHLVAWQAPASLQQKVNVTLVKADDDMHAPVSAVGVYDASRGASGEVPVTLNGQSAGSYRFHLVAGQCTADSAPFEVTAASQDFKNAGFKNAVQQSPADHQDAADKYFTNNDQRTHPNAAFNAELDQLVDEDGDSGHENAQWFTNDEQRSHVNGWNREELEEISSDVWHDNSANNEPLPDHTNASPINADELDAQEAELEGVWEEPHVNSNEQEGPVADYTNASHWDSADVTDDAEDESHLNAGINAWSELPDHSNEGDWASQDVDDADTTHLDAQWFTNEDQRTQHADAPMWHDNDGEWFTNKDQRAHANDAPETSWEESSTAILDHTDAGAWSAEDIEDTPAKIWHDNSVVPDHSNAAAWSAEETDTQSAETEGVWTESHSNSNEQDGPVSDYSNENHWDSADIDVEVETSGHENAVVGEWSEIADHSNEGQWSSDDVDASEAAALPDHSDAAGWSAEELHDEPDRTWHDNSAVLPDHSNAAAWSAEETDSQTADAPSTWVEPHSNSDAQEGPVTDFSGESHWDAVDVEEDDEPSHENIALGEWSEAVADHSNDGEWHTNEIADDEHIDAAAPEWLSQEETHANEWHSDQLADNKHRDAAEPQWLSEESQEEPHGNEWHSNQLADNKHRDAADSQSEWVATEDDGHLNSEGSYSSWHEDNTQSHWDSVEPVEQQESHVDVGGLTWAEEKADIHNDSPYFTNEDQRTHKDSVQDTPSETHENQAVW
ncbi:hypothetical protein BCR43DRAFT_566792 [Syncephalastrum racemosum]|uniref:Ser-Thr-rich glycosyl-phosphatidyl-inositol-anchored membrane family-domain-containing protein n=1 Tax=Syncephalastrum racemosum TaxID=13706 RepID=A0A1X2H1F0_SYNRA|nr:hypothetical protein BCR43DRAFT_566792 [Syncephalastrum racemosum]